MRACAAWSSAFSTCSQRGSRHTPVFAAALTPAVAASLTPVLLPVFTPWLAAHAAHAASWLQAFHWQGPARTRQDDVDSRSTISADTPGNDCSDCRPRSKLGTHSDSGDWHPQTSGQSPASSPSLIRDSDSGRFATVAAHWGAAGPRASTAARSTEHGVAGNRLDTTADTRGSKHHCRRPRAPLQHHCRRPRVSECPGALLHAGVFEWAAWRREGDVGTEAGVPDPFIS